MIGKMAGLRFGPFQLLLAVAAGGASLFLLASEHYRFAPLPGLAILLMLTFTHWNRWAYYVFVFLIPFEFLSRLQEGSRVFSVAKVTGVWLTLVVLFSLLLDRSQTRSLRARLWFPIFLYCFISVLSAVFSHYPLIAADNLRKLAVAVTVFALTLFFIDKKGYRRSLPEVLIWGVIINYVFFMTVYLFNLPLTIGGEPLFATSASEPSYNLQGATSSYFVFLLPLLVHRVFFSTSTVTKNIYAGLTFLAVSGMVFFGSRAVALMFVAVTVMLFIQYLSHIKPKMIGFFLAFLCAAAALTLAFVPDRYWTRMANVVETQTDASIGRRVTYLEVSWEAFKARPFLGAGPGAFQELYSQTLQAAKFAETAEEMRRPAHNTYLEILVGSGIFGLAAFFGIAVVAVKNFRRAVRRFREHGMYEEELLVSAYLTMFVGQLVIIFFATRPYDKFTWILIAISQVVLASAERGGAEGRGAAPAEHGQESPIGSLAPAGAGVDGRLAAEERTS